MELNGDLGIYLEDIHIRIHLQHDGVLLLLIRDQWHVIRFVFLRYEWRFFLQIPILPFSFNAGAFLFLLISEKIGTYELANKPP